MTYQSSPLKQHHRPGRVGVRDLQMGEIIAAASEAFQQPVAEILSECRSRRIARARWAAAKIAYEHTSRSYPQIGRAMKRDHTSILYGHREANKLCATNAAYAIRVERALALAEAKRAQRLQRLTANGYIIDGLGELIAPEAVAA